MRNRKTEEFSKAVQAVNLVKKTKTRGQFYALFVLSESV